MKRLLLIAALSVLAIGQVPRDTLHNDVRCSALSVTSEGAVRHLRGAVEIETSSMTLFADEADFNGSTGEILPRGNVRVKLK